MIRLSKKKISYKSQFPGSEEQDFFPQRFSSRRQRRLKWVHVFIPAAAAPNQLISLIRCLVSGSSPANQQSSSWSCGGRRRAGDRHSLCGKWRSHRPCHDSGDAMLSQRPSSARPPWCTSSEIWYVTIAEPTTMAWKQIHRRFTSVAVCSWHCVAQNLKLQIANGNACLLKRPLFFNLHFSHACSNCTLSKMFYIPFMLRVIVTDTHLVEKKKGFETGFRGFSNNWNVLWKAKVVLLA